MGRGKGYVLTERGQPASQKEGEDHLPRDIFRTACSLPTHVGVPYTTVYAPTSGADPEMRAELQRRRMSRESHYETRSRGRRLATGANYGLVSLGGAG